MAGKKTQNANKRKKEKDLM
jgi:hypothetical protein